MTRAEHLAWCKGRALVELEYYGDNPNSYRNALASMASNLGKHPETKSVALTEFCIMSIPLMKSKADVIKFIAGFN